jgi:hypothetical protein
VNFQKIKLIEFGQLQNHKSFLSTKKKTPEKMKIHTREKATHPFYHLQFSPQKPARKERKNEKIP